jgi:hypothetical protein
MLPKIENLTSPNGNSVPNQFRIVSDSGVTFQSYESIICHIANDGRVTLDEKTWNYSNTTSKYRALFRGEPTKVTERKIKDGTYKLANLN